MKHIKTNIGIITVSILLLSACAPKPNENGGPHGPKLSPEALFQKADANGDNTLTFEEFEAALPEKGNR
jgi:hypothetical protein